MLYSVQPPPILASLLLRSAQRNQAYRPDHMVGHSGRIIQLEVCAVSFFGFFVTF
jgi:hypothetical protein